MLILFKNIRKSNDILFICVEFIFEKPELI